VADAAGHEPDERLAGPGLIELDLLDGQRLPELLQHGGADLHAAIVLGDYALFVKQFATGRLAQTAGKYAEHAPAATACCNACRTCVQTNLLALAAAAVVGSAAALRRLASCRAK